MDRRDCKYKLYEPHLARFELSLWLKTRVDMKYYQRALKLIQVGEGRIVVRLLDEVKLFFTE